MYKNRIQVMVYQWVAFRPVFEVCVQHETCYEVGVRRQPPWWRQMVVDAQLRVTLEDIAAEVRERR